MSWVKQCQTIVVNEANKVYAMNKGMTKYQVVEKLSKQSKIPADIIRRWWNVKIPKSKLCTRCKGNPVYITRTGKPWGKNSIYYGLCVSCRKQKEKENKNGRHTT